jgi:hypothetical protein
MDWELRVAAHFYAHRLKLWNPICRICLQGYARGINHPICGEEEERIEVRE